MVLDLFAVKPPEHVKPKQASSDKTTAPIGSGQLFFSLLFTNKRTLFVPTQQNKIHPQMRFYPMQRGALRRKFNPTK
jgi:hypothetical protein